jgi:negative regulator of flagellin synthesis FlgM
MKVNLNGTTPDPIISQQGNRSSAQAPNVGYEHDQDKATLSLGQDNIAALTSQAMATSDIRQEKVAALRQAISSGQYKVEPEKVAEAMLQESANTKSGS